MRRPTTPLTQENSGPLRRTPCPTSLAAAPPSPPSPLTGLLAACGGSSDGSSSSFDVLRGRQLDLRRDLVVGVRPGHSPEGQGPAPVGHPGAVLLLLRGEGPGLCRSTVSTSTSSRCHRHRSDRCALTSGGADYAISWVPKVLGAIEQGARSPTSRRSSSAQAPQISFKDKNITKPADLKGKKVGSWGLWQRVRNFAGMQKDGVTSMTSASVQQAST